MRNAMRGSIEDVFKRLGKPTLPKEIWQKPYHDRKGRYRHLAELYDVPLADARFDFRDYYHVINYDPYETIQPDLFKYLLPVCLKAWREDLMPGPSPLGGFVEWFLPALARRPLLSKMLQPEEQEAVIEFMRDSILDCMEKEPTLAVSKRSASPYSWFYNLGAFAVIFPHLDSLWKTWWGMETTGLAVSVLQYISCLMYENDRNPIFAPWTRGKGGGPPCLWEVAGHIYDQLWHPDNVDFLARTLTVAYVKEHLERAAQLLKAKAQCAVSDKMVLDFTEQEALLELRLTELPDLLSRPLLDGEWSV